MKNNSGKINILIIDDEEDIRNFVSRLLQMEGYKVQAVESGELGLSAIKSRKFSLVILDLKLPGIDGWAVIKEVKKDSSLLSLPILLFTASVSELERNKTHEYENVGFLPKPVNVLKLKKMVKRALSPNRR